MWFGPVMERRSRTVVDWSPVDPERTEKLLAERESVTVGDVREFLASTQQGLGAIEHGLFGYEPAVLEQLSQRNGIGCRYLTGLVLQLHLNCGPLKVPLVTDSQARAWCRQLHHGYRIGRSALS